MGIIPPPPTEIQKRTNIRGVRRKRNKKKRKKIGLKMGNFPQRGLKVASFSPIAPSGRDRHRLQMARNNWTGTY